MSRRSEPPVLELPWFLRITPSEEELRRALRVDADGHVVLGTHATTTCEHCGLVRDINEHPHCLGCPVIRLRKVRERITRMYLQQGGANHRVH